MNTEKNDAYGKSEPSCNVNSRFNFTVGGFAIAVTLLISYLVYVYLWK